MTILYGLNKYNGSESGIISSIVVVIGRTMAGGKEGILI